MPTNPLNAKFVADALGLLGTAGNAVCGHDNLHLAAIGSRAPILRIGDPTWLQADALVSRMNERRLISLDFHPFKHDMEGGGSMMMLQPRFDTPLLGLDKPEGFPDISTNPVRGYWFPYITATPQQFATAKDAGGPPSLMGWVDFPKRDPTYPYVFTGSMQGCHIVVTKSPASADHFRAYHYPSPGNVKRRAGDMTMRYWPIATGGRPVFWLDDKMYAADAPAAVDAFNFLRYRDGAWYCVSQRNERKTIYKEQVGHRMPYFDAFIVRDVLEHGPIRDEAMDNLTERYTAWAD